MQKVILKKYDKKAIKFNDIIDKNLCDKEGLKWFVDKYGNTGVNHHNLLCDLSAEISRCLLHDKAEKFIEWHRWIKSNFSEYEERSDTVCIIDCTPDEIYISISKNLEYISKLTYTGDGYLWRNLENSSGSGHAENKGFSKQLRDSISLGFDVYRFFNIEEMVTWLYYFLKKRGPLTSEERFVPQIHPVHSLGIGG